jgi:hypothetical protein
MDDFAPSQAISCILYLPESFTSGLASAYTHTLLLESTHFTNNYNLSDDVIMEPLLAPLPEDAADELNLIDGMDINNDTVNGAHPSLSPPSPLPASSPSPAEPSDELGIGDHVHLDEASPQTSMSTLPVTVPMPAFEWTVPIIKQPQMHVNMSKAKCVCTLETYLNDLEAITCQESHLHQTAVAQHDMLAGELQAMWTQEQAECNACKRPKKQVQYKGSWLIC